MLQFCEKSKPDPHAATAAAAATNALFIRVSREHSSTARIDELIEVCGAGKNSEQGRVE